MPVPWIVVPRIPDWINAHKRINKFILFSWIFYFLSFSCWTIWTHISFCCWFRQGCRIECYVYFIYRNLFLIIDFNKNIFIFSLSMPENCPKKIKTRPVSRIPGHWTGKKVSVLFYLAKAAFASSTIFVKPSASWIAISESILRLMSMLASFRPCISLE